ncbi:MAG TPA: universal stress protein [Blastocatellia bacterium]|nr:universal stress protein [Blastocatellia bacterium]
MKIQDVLVPTDFSPNSLRAVEFAVSLTEQGGEICLLHVVDTDFVARLTDEGFSNAGAATAKLREKAERQLQETIASVPDPKPRLEPMVVVGRPFAEILRIADDLDFGMIALGARGRRGADLEEMLFGSTAEKVIRASRVPVVCVPMSWSRENAG